MGLRTIRFFVSNPKWNSMYIGYKVVIIKESQMVRLLKLVSRRLHKVDFQKKTEMRKLGIKWYQIKPNNTSPIKFSTRQNKYQGPPFCRGKNFGFTYAHEAKPVEFHPQYRMRHASVCTLRFSAASTTRKPFCLASHVHTSTSPFPLPITLNIHVTFAYKKKYKTLSIRCGTIIQFK